MTKVKLQNATKELALDAGRVLEETSRIKNMADALLQTLRQLENRLSKEEELLQMQLRMEEQQRIIDQQQRAWTMPDEEDETEYKQTDIQTQDDNRSSAVTEVEDSQTILLSETDKPRDSHTNMMSEEGDMPAITSALPESAIANKSNELTNEPAPIIKQPSSGMGTPTGVTGSLNSTPRPTPSPERPVSPRYSQSYPHDPTRGARPNQTMPPVRTQGTYARPGIAATTNSSYGRQPFNPNQPRPMGYPPNQQGIQRPYGRPVQQGVYGRPANPAQANQARPSGFVPRTQQQPFPGRTPAGGRPAPGGPRMKPADLAPVLEKERVSNYDPNKKSYIRQHDPERVAKTKKQLSKEQRNLSGYDDDVIRSGKKTRRKLSAQQLMAPIKIEKAFMTAQTITVKDLTERIGKSAGEIIKKLLLLGIMATINSELDFDTASLVCDEFGVGLEMKLDKTAEDFLSDENVTDTEEQLQIRPPVITIMGHVDHGKTSLLDYIRKTHVVSSEAGGITQHIGAYTARIQDRQITFLDTPGHEAFTAMRARGAQATDIAVLVVAADDGVMPQTVEAINHAKAAEVPIIVAINKIDKESANPERIKTDLTAYNMVSEEWGGDTTMVPVSAVTGEGIDMLLEMILLQADVLQLRANPNRLARGVIIEAKLDKSRGPVATVLVQNGTLRVGDNIVAGTASGRVRSMLSDRGDRLEYAEPSTPVEVSGFTDVPFAGDEMMSVGDDHLSKQVAQERRDKVKASRSQAGAKLSLDNLFSNMEQNKKINLNLVVKADVQGSVEAVKQALEKLSDDDVHVRILHSAVGAITKDDVNLASAFNAIIIGFNIRPDNSARDTAEKESVDIRLYRVIYQAVDDIEKAMKGLLAPMYKETLLGHAQVRSIFRITGVGTIAGCYITDGKVQRNALVRLLRDNVVIFEGKLSSLKRFKDDAREVTAGYECGIGLENYNDLKENDVIECYMQEQVER